jgi:FtsH-binding integral membrane protein
VYVTESGRIAYAFGLLVTLFACASHQVTALSPAVSASIAFITCVAGMLVWVLASHAILKEAGKIAFACGLLVSLFEVATHVVRF